MSFLADHKPLPRDELAALLWHGIESEHLSDVSGSLHMCTCLIECCGESEWQKHGVL